VEQYPRIVQRIVAEGHEIGNHTYTHQNLSEASSQQIRLELNATQRLIESITGLSTTLFRPPYNADSRPSDIQELRPLKLIQDELDYLIVLEGIDPEDWGRPGADVIFQRVKQLRHMGSTILLHDAGETARRRSKRSRKSSTGSNSAATTLFPSGISCTSPGTTSCRQSKRMPHR